MPDPLLSIVTGTYNRLNSLQRMIHSVRSQLPRHIVYEFVLVDGGSRDDTQRWCLKQPDVRLIEHGELRGAIRAFCDGANAARGEYVLLANDDVLFAPGSILRAIAHLESTRTCGAVAFADDRTRQMEGKGPRYRVMGMPAVSPSGDPIHVPYAQVGLIRRWLGDAVGWWGADDAVMGKARTYGGDNYLSSRIWEVGYTVDPVAGCQVDDLIPRDDLRVQNGARGGEDSAQYYARFPRGAQIPERPALDNPQPERLRILLCDIHEPHLPAASQAEEGLAEALARVGLIWHIDYLNETYDLAGAVRTWQPHLLLTQLHDVEHITADDLRAARAEKPDLVLVNWNGDAHEGGLVGEAMLEALHEVDLQTCINAAVFPVYEAEGIPHAYWQIGYKDPAQTYTRAVPAHEVLFLGNCYNAERYALVEALRATGRDVGIYGHCPEADGLNHYDFAAGRALYQACGVAISDTFEPEKTVGFVSNRLLQALASGAFVLQQVSRELTTYTGLEEGVHLVMWSDLDDLAGKIEHWLAPAQLLARQAIAEAGRVYVRSNYSYDAQVAKLWGLLAEAHAPEVARVLA